MWPEHEGLPNGRLTQAAPAARNGCMRTPVSKQSAAVGMWDFMAITKALSDENRVRALLALQGQELCLCQIVELLDLATSTVSKHMSILRQARLVESRKEGRWMYYRWPGRYASPAVRQALQWAKESLTGDARVSVDQQHLREILAMDPEQLCERQSSPGKTCGRTRDAARGRTKA